MNTNEIIEYLRAGFPCIWIKTAEAERIEREVFPTINNYDKIDFNCTKWNLTDQKDPMAAIAELNNSPANTITFAENFHWFLDKPPIIQALKNALPVWANEGKCFVVVSHTIKIPAELEKDFIVMDHELPDSEVMMQTIEHIVPEAKYMPKKDDAQKIVEASRGLTRKELESVYSLSLIREKKIDPNVVNAFKEQAINKTGYLTVLRSNKTFADVIGYEEVKQHVMATYDNPDAKGFIMIGPPGTGKTSVAEAITNETGKFGLVVDMGKLFSKFIGDTDKNVDFVISLITSIGNCFVLIDEFEKQFAGASGGGEGDSGTTKRALSKWLNFLQNRPRGIYIVATANSVEGIPAEYLRPGRWDCSPFAMDLPTSATANKILKHYVDKHGVSANGTVEVNDFSGAELEALVKMAAMRDMDLKAARKFIVPVAKSMGEKINALRDWAQQNCIPADKNVKQSIKRRLAL